MDTVNYHDRSTEFWSFAPDMTLDSKGKRTKQPGVFFLLWYLQQVERWDHAQGVKSII